MENFEKEIFKQRHEKWKMASKKLVDIRFLLEDIFSSFSEDEKQTQRYRQLIEDLKNQVEYVVGNHYSGKHIREEIQEAAKEYYQKHNFENSEKKSSKISSESSFQKEFLKIKYKYKTEVIYIFIATLGAIIMKILDFLFSFLRS
ncbi:MAG: hypothetical protein NZZ41_04655 [Candidatus Dojkabacteria bacterium]|nr:hypothetical protein [Candidatus Dojkabacteria bacterium]